MSTPPWTSERDFDPNYLLGGFDAERMLRLEGLGSERRIGNLFIELQLRYPTFLRNLQYVTSAAPFDRRGYVYGALAQVANPSAFPAEPEDILTQGNVLAPWRQPPFVFFNARWFCSSTSKQNQTSVHPNSQRVDTVGKTSLHEYSHVLHHELLLSDSLRKTTHHRELNEVTRILLPSFRPGSLDDNQRDELKAYSVLNGGEGVADTLELTAELMRISSDLEALAGQPAELITAATAMRDLLQTAWSPATAKDRHSALLEKAPTDWLAFDIIGNTCLSQTHAQAFGERASNHYNRKFAVAYETICRLAVGKDPRFEAGCLLYEIFEATIVGIDRLQQLTAAETVPTLSTSSLQTAWMPELDLREAVKTMTTNFGNTTRFSR